MNDAPDDPPRNDGQRRYARGALVLHWLTAAAFAFQVGLGWQMGGERGPRTFAAFQLHKSIGITILLLTIMRISWRVAKPAPAFPATVTAAERMLAQVVHGVFYLLLLGLPLSGWLLVSSSRLAVPTLLYGTIPWPHMPGIATLGSAAKQSVSDAAATAHLAMVWIALAAVALHVAGALKHQWFERGDYLGRMVPLPSHALSVVAALLVFCLVSLSALGRSVHLAPISRTPPTDAAAQNAVRSAPAQPLASPLPPPPAPMASPSAMASPVPLPSPSPSPIPAGSSVVTVATPSRWSVRTGASSIRFRTRWSQGTVDGGFGSWTAAVTFDPAALAASSVTVTVDLASVTAADSTQQSALPGTDWFAAATHPQAIWRSSGFTHLGGDRYRASGRLSLRGAERPVSVTFTVTITGDVALVTGTTGIDRTAFGVGQGEWASTTDLPAVVGLSFTLKADRATPVR